VYALGVTMFNILFPNTYDYLTPGLVESNSELNQYNYLLKNLKSLMMRMLNEDHVEKIPTIFEVLKEITLLI